jgi:hypothetical protein
MIGVGWKMRVGVQNGQLDCVAAYILCGEQLCVYRSDDDGGVCETVHSIIAK